MGFQPSARDRILLAFEGLLIDEGERSATLEAVAAAAGVSKGGLLYHFSSRDALVAGLMRKVRDLAEVDFAAMQVSPEGPARYYVRTSAFSGTVFDCSLLAAMRLTQGQDPRVRETLELLQRTWLDLILTEVHEPALARTILLLGDGLYYNAALVGVRAGSASDGTEVGMEALLGVVDALRIQGSSVAPVGGPAGTPA